MTFIPQTVQTMTPGVKQSGTWDGNQIPWPAGALTVEATGLLSGPDVADPTKSCQIALLMSSDGGQTWDQQNTMPWTGGNLERDNVTYGPPNVSTNFVGSGAPPTHITTRVITSKPMSIGAQLAFS